MQNKGLTVIDGEAAGAWIAPRLGSEFGAVTLLADHTDDPSHCFFGLCTINGWKDSISADELEPFLELPYGRDHIVLTGPLSVVDQIMFYWSGSLQFPFGGREDTAPPPPPEPAESRRREAPSLIWPVGHS